MHLRTVIAALAFLGVVLTGCSSSSDSASTTTSSPTTTSARAVVLVSGVASVTPFTTSDAACTTGSSAGITWGPKRDYLVDEGFAVYTAPMKDVPGEQVPTTLDDTYRGVFGGCPEQPTFEVTGTTINDPEETGKKFAAFIDWLNAEYGITSVDVVAHSLGGIVSRNGIRTLEESKSPVRVRSFTTLSSPWEPLMLTNPPYEPEKACDGLDVCAGIVKSLLAVPELSVVIDSFQPPAFAAWTERQKGVLDDVPVILVSGTMLTKPGGNPDKWPNDGYVQYNAGLARSVPDSVLPQRACFAFPFSHSSLTSGMAGAPAIEYAVAAHVSVQLELQCLHESGYNKGYRHRRRPRAEEPAEQLSRSGQGRRGDHRHRARPPNRPAHGHGT